MEKIEIKASSVDKAIEEGLSQLGITREEAEIEVVSEGGLFSKAVINIVKKESAADAVINFLNGLFEKMSLRCYADCTEAEDELNVNITGQDSGIIIGYRGEVLDAIQYLALILVNEKGHNFIRVSINAENYREKREQTLEALAGRLAYKAYCTGKKIELEHMNPFERRIIHTALADSKFATTESAGEDLERHIVIVPKEGGVRPGYDRGDRPQYNRDRGDRRNNYNRGDRPQYNRDRSDRPQYNREDRPQYNREDRPQYDSAPSNGENQSVDKPYDYSVRRNGPPKVRSFGGPKKRF